jgi:hypothetical protein
MPPKKASRMWAVENAKKILQGMEEVSQWGATEMCLHAEHKRLKILPWAGSRGTGGGEKEARGGFQSPN